MPQTKIMNKIIWNNIERAIALKFPQDKEEQRLIKFIICDKVFWQNKTRWTRILNNSSQPTMYELILISDILKKPVESLVEYGEFIHEMTQS